MQQLFKDLEKFPKVDRSLIKYFEFQYNRSHQIDPLNLHLQDYRTLSGWIDAFFREHGIYFVPTYYKDGSVEFDIFYNNKVTMPRKGKDYQQAHISAMLKAAEILEEQSNDM